MDRDAIREMVEDYWRTFIHALRSGGALAAHPSAKAARSEPIAHPKTRSDLPWPSSMTERNPTRGALGIPSRQLMGPDPSDALRSDDTENGTVAVVAVKTGVAPDCAGRPQAYSRLNDP
jgi:hypothetical protein